MKCVFTHSETPHEGALKATEQCGCNTDDCAVMCRRCVFQLSVLLVSISKCGKILLHNGFVLFPPLVKYAEVRGQTDLSVPSAPSCSQTVYLCGILHYIELRFVLGRAEEAILSSIVTVVFGR